MKIKIIIAVASFALTYYTVKNSIAGLKKVREMERYLNDEK